MINKTENGCIKSKSQLSFVDYSNLATYVASD